MLSRSPPAVRGCFGSISTAISASPRSGGRRGFGAADASPRPCEGLWEYPAPRGGRDAPSCTNPAASLQPRVAFNQPNGASIPMQSVAKHHLEAIIPPSQAPRASKSCFAQRWGMTERSHPVLADALLDRRCLADGSREPVQRWLWPRRYFGAGISSERPSGVPKREGAAVPLFSSAAIVHQPNCSASSCKGERRGAVSGGRAVGGRCHWGAGSPGDK